ncbi:YcxB family protein [Vibrio maerlii]|uniref:YcxB family protein n=1 Tax=Vibrio maerlii TaxID=2231648 RepID=UPI000E3E01A4|nr:YcxB family protein [Vibrio maerlii]
MSKDSGFTTEYTLDKAFFAECFDQTSQPIKFPHAYWKSLLFLIFGVGLLELELLPNGYVGWFFIVLSVVEAFSVYCRRTWWLWRQTISSGANSKVIFEGDEDGVTYTNRKTSNTLAWNNIDQVEQTDLGLILHIGKQRQYVSKSCLDEDAVVFILEQHEKSKAK